MQKGQEKTREFWYGVVYGQYHLLAISELIEEFPDIWEGFMWPATILNSGCNLKVLKKLA